MKRLIFMGPHCSGKTTRARFAYQLLKALGFKVEFRREGVRKCPYPINEQGDYRSQKWILDYYEERDLKPTSAEFVVMDRCSLDTIPYSRYLHSIGRISAQDLNKLVIRAYEIFWNMHGKVLIFYCHPLPLKANGVRSTSKEFREFVTREFERLIGELPFKVIHLGR